MSYYITSRSDTVQCNTIRLNILYYDIIYYTTLWYTTTLCVYVCVYIYIYTYRSAFRFSFICCSSTDAREIRCAANAKLLIVYRFVVVLPNVFESCRTCLCCRWGTITINSYRWINICWQFINTSWLYFWCAIFCLLLWRAPEVEADRRADDELEGVRPGSAPAKRVPRPTGTWFFSCQQF